MKLSISIEINDQMLKNSSIKYSEYDQKLLDQTQNSTDELVQYWKDLNIIPNIIHYNIAIVKDYSLFPNDGYMACSSYNKQILINMNHPEYLNMLRIPIFNKIVLIHELIHCIFRVGHSSNKENLMYPEFIANSVFTIYQKYLTNPKLFIENEVKNASLRDFHSMSLDYIIPYYNDLFKIALMIITTFMFIMFTIVISIIILSPTEVNTNKH